MADVVKTDDGTASGAVVGGIAPQFRSLLPAVDGDPNPVQAHIDIAISLNRREFWQDGFCLAVAYHAAHTLALAYPALAQGVAGASGSGGSGSGATIASLNAGDLSISYAPAAAAAQGGSSAVGAESYNETSWGRMYLQLARARRRSPALYFG
jgi:hypothetical protein